jgi:hypothetical protein
MTQLSLFDQTPDLHTHFLWCVPRGGNRFVVGFAAPVPAVTTAWLKAHGVVCVRAAGCRGGAAALISVPSSLIPLFKRLPSGRGGSSHISNFLGF